MVTVKMNGQKQIVDLRIEPEVFASKDQEMLQDLVRAAVNEASRRVDEELANQMKNLAGGIPGMAGMKIPGFVLSTGTIRTPVAGLPFCLSPHRLSYFTYSTVVNLVFDVEGFLLPCDLPSALWR